MRQTIVTYDGQSIPFDGQYLPLVEKNMREKTPFRIGGAMVQGADIRRVEPERKGEYGPHLASEGRSVFEIGPGVKPGFWQEFVSVNWERKKNGKRWLMNADLMPMKNRCRSMDAGDLMALIEWQEA